MQKYLITANDNGQLSQSAAEHAFAQSKLWQPRHQDGHVISTSAHSPVRTGVRIKNTKIPAPVSTPHQKNKKNKRQKTSRLPVYILLLLWFIAVAGIARFAGNQTGNLLSGESLAGAAGGLGLLSFALASTARRRGARICHSIGIAGACVCLAGLGWFYMQKTDIIVSPEYLTLGLAASCTVLAWLWRTPFLLHMSLLFGVGLSASAFLTGQVSELIWLFPALWSMQMFLALEFRIKRTIALTILAGLLWIGVNLFLLA